MNLNLLYGSQNVDAKYSSAIEPNLYSDTVLIPGVTFTQKYQTGPAGGIFVHKLDSGNKVEVGKPGRHFNGEDAKDELIPIIFNNNFQKERDIYGVQAAAVAFPIAEEYLADALNITKEARQYSALACLVNEGTVSENTVEVTEDNAVETLTGLRKEVKDGKGKANYAMVSTDIYAKLLNKLGLAQVMDTAVVNGELMKRFGLTIIECNSFDEAAAKYYDKTNALVENIDLTKVDMIVGYNEAFSLLDNFATYRLIDTEEFSGSKAQVEFNSAMTVNSPSQVIVKKHA